MNKQFALITFFLMIGSILMLQCTPKQNGPKPEAPLFDGLDSYSLKITTKSSLAQKFFDQGLLLTFGFNHAEAFRSFKEASRQDPDCAMCYWGMGFVLGPNYNAAMMPEDVPTAYEATQKALAHTDKVSDWEKAMIEALSKRYVEEAVEDRSALDQAYADAMGKVYKQFPENNDVACFYVESLMDLHPWDLWERNGDPKPWTPQIVELVESILKRNPKHPNANHMYIHVTEASQKPELAVKSARILMDLVPGSGHLVHMPAHTYIRTGDYHLGTIANLRAVSADSLYVTKCHAQGLYPLAYYPHNYHFLAATAALEGNGEVAMNAAFEMAKGIDTELMKEEGYGTLQHYYMVQYNILVKFAQWDRILKEKKAPADLPYPQAIWEYARGMAFSARGNMKEAKASLAKLKSLAQDPALRKLTVWDINNLGDVADIAERVLEADIANKEKQYTKAISLLKQAVVIEDNLNYNEPPEWFFSVRHMLGAIYLETGNYVAAEKAYREDLYTFRKNGWALNGLSHSLEKQGKTEEAQKVKLQFEEAWQWADTPLTDSRVDEIAVSSFKRTGTSLLAMMKVAPQAAGPGCGRK